ncbi:MULTISPECIES: hypothetical protein [unclassified Bradyrhizobium]|uniref:hypothetical protein n=1 Tax=unclassified Bradyrhizobium TaxID=2631580 RepID=UPI00247AE2EC|nr:MULTISPECIES: hypothetical protein [unclassified Bradyrhizobium]WGR70487.1 hypothetical protein MTX24_34890 [Bradyrhizobium sp. ISRA426]WGR82543.1 hypothetical protein MTX21_19990 [Bradyrhizobium sp. ISRA430]WGR85730.1 hypothetical protein MTX25_34575 [Bradyrhizobium sp. ISRA432]
MNGHSETTAAIEPSHALCAVDISAEADRLARLADQCTDPAVRAAYQRACRAFFQQSPGRKAKYEALDRSLSREVDIRLAEGNVKSERDVILSVVLRVSSNDRELNRHYRRIVRYRLKQGIRPVRKKV